MMVTEAGSYSASLQVATSKIDEYARGMISGSGSTLFEELGLYYIGPVDGHNMDDLVTVLNDVRSADTVGPVLIHVITEKGRGYLPAETAQVLHNSSSSSVLSQRSF